MKIKWKCLIKALGYPLIAAIVIFITFFVVIMGFLWYMAETTPPITNLTELHRSGVMIPSNLSYNFPFVFIVIIILVILLLAMFRELIKPCFIKENTGIDKIVTGISGIFDIIQFFISAILFISGVLSIIYGINKIIFNTHTFSNDGSPIGLFIYASITFVISYIIYPKLQNNNKNLEENNGKI